VQFLRLAATAERDDRRVLEEDDRIGDRALGDRTGERALEVPGFLVRNEAEIEQVGAVGSCGSA
jgi:hypothetical protein